MQGAGGALLSHAAAAEMCCKIPCRYGQQDTNIMIKVASLLSIAQFSKFLIQFSKFLKSFDWLLHASI